MVRELSEINYVSLHDPTNDSKPENRLTYETIVENSTEDFYSENGRLSCDFKKMNTYFFSLSGVRNDINLSGYFIGYKAHSVYHALLYHFLFEKLPVEAVYTQKPLGKPYKLVKDVYKSYITFYPDRKVDKFYKKTLFKK